MTRALFFAAAVLPLAAQPKLLINAKVDTRPAASGLETLFRSLMTSQPQPMWIGYTVPAVRTRGSLGCDYVRDSLDMPGVVHLEPPDHALILFRVENNTLDRVRSMSPDCEIDAGGLPVHWLTDVQPAQSVALLTSFANERESFGPSAVTAIAMHADPSADAALNVFIAPDKPEWLRQRAVSLFGSTRGKAGLDVLKKVIANDRDENIRRRAVNAIGSSREPESAEMLIAIARNDSDPQMRMAALNGLTRKQGAAIVSTIQNAIENDPDSQVRRRAVNVLYQLQDGEGVPTLIQLVKTAKDQEVRKAAMNSLRNSRDPRALAFFEDVLKQQ